MASPGAGDLNSIWRGAIFMLNPLITIPIGVILGFLAALGIGGGSLLILWLTLVVNMPQTTARGINLMFFIVAATSVSLVRWKKGNLDFKAILPAVISGCIAAGVCSWLGGKLDPNWLRKIFGGLLLVTGVRELFYRPRKAK